MRPCAFRKLHQLPPAWRPRPSGRAREAAQRRAGFSRTRVRPRPCCVMMCAMARRVKRAFTYRFYPTPEQAKQLARTFGCARLVYNKALEERSRAHTLHGRSVSYGESSAMLAAWKRTQELGFLGEVS